MKRKLLFGLFALLTFVGTRAEEWPAASQLTPLGLDPAVKHGTLDNGLDYFILHNEEPKGKANFYIAQKVGSAQEEPNQLGLAHFLEHMAFNGSSNFPPGYLDKYLQSKGLRSGADVNAGTGYDQTVYNINNVPTYDQNLMDSVLLVLYDMSCGILLSDDEIEAERGVIREEMRLRENAMQRMLNTISPIIFPEYQYQHPIIGSEEVIMNFTPDEIRAYYKKWYRPDLQGIIIVGDFNADEMEKKVIELFSQVKMPKNSPERVYPPFTGNEEPIYTYYSDPEMRYQLAEIFFKSEPVPFDIRSTVQMYTLLQMPKTIVTTLLNQRLQEFGLSPECEYAGASASFGDFLVSKSAEAFSVEVIAKRDLNQAVSQAMAVIARACQTGFTETEFDRAKDIILAFYDNKVNEKDKTDNDDLAQNIIEYFLFNEPNPGIEEEQRLWKQALKMFPLEMINQFCGELLTTDNLVVVCAQPEKEGFDVISEEVMIGTITEALEADYEPYVDETIDEPLISELPQPGKILSKEENPEYGVVYTLSNGAKVIVKTTDFAADEIYFTAFKKGGLQSYETTQAPDVLVMGEVFSSAKYGPFDHNAFKKYLAGKRISLGLSITTDQDILIGRSTVKDLNNFMEYLYTSFTNLDSDTVAFNSYLQSQIADLTHKENTPNYKFAMKFQSTIYGDNPLMNLPTVKTFEQVDYSKSLALVKALLNNAADFTFVFVGNIESSIIEPLMEQYIASLPSAMASQNKVMTPISVAKGQIKEVLNEKMQTPAVYIADLYSGYNVPYSVKNSIMLDMIGEVVRNVFFESLREDEGGTYSPMALADYNQNNHLWELTYQVVTAPEKSENIQKRADKELDNLFANGTDMKHFGEVKEANIQHYKDNIRNNRYWIYIIRNQVLYPEVNIISEYEPALNSITLDEFNDFFKTLYNGENRIQVILNGTSE